MKKFISIVLVALMLVGILPVNVLAANTTITATADKTELNIGDEVEVAFTIADNPGFAAATFVFDFDHDMFKFKGLKKRTNEYGEEFIYGLLSTAVYTYVDNPVKKVAWASANDTKVNAVLFKAIFEAVGPGTSPLTLTVEELRAADGTHHTNNVTVIPSAPIKVNAPAATALTLDKETLTMVPGDSETLTASLEPANATESISWQSSDPAVAEVNDKGLVTAQSQGTATITAMAGNLSATCLVTVEISDEEALLAAKDAAIAELKTYKNADDYREAEKAALSTLIAEGNTAIDNATDEAGVAAALQAAKTKIDALKTAAEYQQEELATAKANAKTDLAVYKNADDYREAEKAALSTLIAEGNTAIDNATDEAGVAAALQTAKDKMDALKTAAEYDEEDAQAAALVDEKIISIGTVTLEKAGQISDVRSAYQALEQNAKQKVSQLAVLEAAEATLEQLKKEVADQQAAKEVEDLISAIGEVTLDKENQINEAQSAYNRLTADQKELVGNAEVLNEAVRELKRLKDEQDPKTVLSETIEKAKRENKKDYSTKEYIDLKREIANAKKVEKNRRSTNDDYIKATQALNDKINSNTTDPNPDEPENPAEATANKMQLKKLELQVKVGKARLKYKPSSELEDAINRAEALLAQNNPSQLEVLKVIDELKSLR